MQRKYSPINGIAVQIQDLTTLGASAASADDAILLELLKIPAYDGSNVAKVILPGENPLITPGVGKVTVGSFRAIVGSRTTSGTDAELNLKDIRSGVFVGPQDVTFAANAGLCRWDLIAAKVTIDTPESTVTRKLKDPTSGVVSAVNTTPILITKVELQVFQGTGASLPSFPSPTADADPVYYIPIAYVRLNTAFTTLTANDINPAFTPVPISTTMGTASLRPASGNMTGGDGLIGTGTSINGVQQWEATPGARPAVYLPPTMAGSESLLVVLDLTNAIASNWSHQDLAIVDDSRDWRKRIWRWTASVGYGSTTIGSGYLPWVNTAGTIANFSTPGYAGSSEGQSLAIGMADSFSHGTDPYVVVLQASGSANNTYPDLGSNIPTNVMPAGTAVNLRVSNSTGKLYLAVTGVPRVKVVLWIEASGQYT